MQIISLFARPHAAAGHRRAPVLVSKMKFVMFAIGSELFPVKKRTRSVPITRNSFAPFSLCVDLPVDFGRIGGGDHAEHDQ
jgi:hypothetical protein